MNTEEELREAVRDWEWAKWKAGKRQDLQKAKKPIPASEEKWEELLREEVYTRLAFREILMGGPDFKEWAQQHEWPSIDAVNKLLAELKDQIEELSPAYEGQAPFIAGHILLNDLLDGLPTEVTNDASFETGIAVGWKLRELFDLAGIGVKASQGIAFDRGRENRMRKKTASQKPTWKKVKELWPIYEEDEPEPTKTGFVHEFLADEDNAKKYSYGYNRGDDFITVEGKKLAKETILKRLKDHISGG